MLIELSEEQADELRCVLDTTLREFSYEIASADLPAFRRMLRGRRETIRSILDEVGGPLSLTQRSSNSRN